MASGSHSRVVDLEVDEECVTDKSIKEKVWSLKSAFMSQHFAEVEGLLLAMKEKMEKEKELMEEKARSERLKAEIELKECKRECSQLKKVQEGFNELLRSSREDKRIIRELRDEICELKCAKLKVETEVDAYKSKFQELEMRVFLLEKDVMLLNSKERVNNVRVSGGVVEEKVVLNGSANSRENVVTVICSYSNDNVAVEVNGDPRSHLQESRNGDVGAPGSVSGEHLGERAVKENGNGSERDGNVKAETVAVDNHEILVLGANGGSGSNLPENGNANIGASGGLTRPSQEIIEIIESDDDSSSSVTLRRKKLTKQKQGCQDEADLGQEDVNTETKSLKRKRTSCSNSKDDSGGSNELRTTKCQVLIQGPESVPVNYCASTTMFSGSNDRINFLNPSRQAPTILRQCEEKISVGQNSQTQRRELVLDGFVGSDGEHSSSSSDDFVFPTDFSAIIKPTRANRILTNWKSEADMVAALEQEVELRLRAVCALFGRQAAVEKSSNFASASQNQGFDKVDAARGIALAGFLTNGDPLGKLKKTDMELFEEDPKGFLDCRRLSIKYSKQLFEMWQLKGDPLFFN